MNPKSKLRPMAVACMTVLGAAMVPATGMAQTASTLESSGYLRAGPGLAKKDAARACYGLDGAGLKYRLGNECDFYTEFLFASKFKKEGLEYSINVMPKLYSPGTDTGKERMDLQQLFVEGKGFDFAPGTTFWAGKAFVGRDDVHIVDTQYIDMSGVGAGARGIALGDSAKLAVALFRNDNGDNTNASKVPGTRVNFDVYDIAANTDGKLRFVATATKGDFTGGKGGYGLTAQHTQSKLPGGLENKVWLQYAQGSAGLNSNFGAMTSDSGVKSVRLLDSIRWQSGPLGGEAQIMGQTDRDGTGAKVQSMTVGGRASYAMTRNFKLVSELGYSQKKPDGSDTQKLTKFTIAPTISTGPGFFDRPELRFYVTSAKWNNAANAAAGAKGLTGIGDGKTSGTSYGFQVEAWW